MNSPEFLNCPRNETVFEYRNESEKRLLATALTKFSQVTHIPIIIGSKEFRTKITLQSHFMPFEHSHEVAKFHYASKALLDKAINNCLKAREEWERRPLQERAKIFLTAADLIANKYRFDLNAAIILGQGKPIREAELDCCQLIDFFRFNAYFASEADKCSKTDELNEIIYRGLEGFVAVITPFCSIAIAGNMISSPALMGNVVLWKPASTAILSNYVLFKILREAGLPPGVVNFVPCGATHFEDEVTSSSHLAGIDFTGSFLAFQKMWKQVGINIELYKTYPRLVGSCGGKNFHFAHPTADIDALVACTMSAAFEYQGQKSSACSCLFVPDSLWSAVKQKLIDEHKKIIVGQPTDDNAFVSAVIDRQAFERISTYIQHAKLNPNSVIIAGGECDSSKGYFVNPTIIECSDMNDKLFTEQIFGPILTVYPYPNVKCYEVLKSIKSSSDYNLAGSIFADHKSFIDKAIDFLCEAAGNLYINDKCTGFAIGQQPFGGGGHSGTNDKAGGPHYVLKWSSPLYVTKNMTPIREWRYPLMD